MIFILFKTLLLQIWPLIYLLVLQYIGFSMFTFVLKIAYFSISYTKYLSLPRSTCRFRVSVWKQAKIGKRVHFILIKKAYIYAMIGSSGRDYVLIILFQLYRSKAGFLKIIYYRWVNVSEWVSEWVCEPSLKFPRNHNAKKTDKYIVA